METDKATRSILLVEDNQADVFLTLRAFKRSGIANPITVASDGQEALDYLFGLGRHANRADFVSPSLVLLDLQLPRVSGHEVLQRIRANPVTRFQPVVILTSSKEDQDIVASYDNGANAYVRKPVEFGEFVTATRSLGFFWLMLNELPPSP